MVIRITGATRQPEVQHEPHITTTPFRMFEDLFNDWAASSAFARKRESIRPAVDILEKEHNFIIRAEIPGITEKDFELTLDGSTLTIRAWKKVEPEDSGYAYHQVESFYGDFTRSFDLPETADAEKISAAYNNGILTITIPQKAEAKPRTIKVVQG